MSALIRQLEKASARPKKKNKARTKKQIRATRDRWNKKHLASRKKRPGIGGRVANALRELRQLLRGRRAGK